MNNDIKISYSPLRRAGNAVRLNGEDITAMVSKVEIPEFGSEELPTVILTLVPTTIDLDLTDLNIQFKSEDLSDARPDDSQPD